MADGRTRLSINPFARTDGTEHKLEQTTIITESTGKQEFMPYSGLMFVSERIDERRTRSVVKRDGKIAEITERTLSDDAKTLTVVRKYPDGRTNAVLVWERHTPVTQQSQGQ